MPTEIEPAATCSYCDEPLAPGEAFSPVPGVHRECAIRMVIGSVAHQEKRCSCYCSGSDEGDPPGVTMREAARLATAAFEQRSIRFRLAHREQLEKDWPHCGN
jgi:hypothetical protein